MSAPYADRCRRLAEEVGRDALAAVLVTPSPDLVYLTGYAPPPLERLTMLVVGIDRSPAMVVPTLELPLAREAVGDRVELLGWNDGADPYVLVAGLVPAAGRVAVADRTWASHVLELQRAMRSVELEPASPVIGRLRAVKDADELAALRRAGRAADETFRQICGLPFLGRREEEVAADLAALLVANGHARADFTIVASGPNSASPHHEPGGRTILPRDAVVLDFGGELAGYCSDTTRTVVVGEAPDGFAEAYEVVREAQEAAIDAVRPGAAAQEIDRAARRVVEAGGFGDRFFHRTGHGIGLEVHEPPYIIEGNETPLIPGMTFSIEPGVYLDGRFGVRIEDIVAVTDAGVERLNRSTRELQIVS